MQEVSGVRGINCLPLATPIDRRVSAVPKTYGMLLASWDGDDSVLMKMVIAILVMVMIMMMMITLVVMMMMLLIIIMIF